MDIEKNQEHYMIIFIFFQFAYVFKKFLLYYLNNKKYFKEYYCITIQGGFTRVLSFFPFYQFKK